MDARVRNAVLAKVDEAVSAADEIREIQKSLRIGGGYDFALGIAVGRIYNSFHYQTRRILGRDSTETEFSEFIVLLSDHIFEIRNALSATMGEKASR